MVLIKLKTRGLGVTLFFFGVVILLGYWLAPVPDFDIGEEIVLWVAPSIKGLDSDRVWHAEQGGRIVRDYERQARADRKIIGIMLPLVPFLMFSGWWLIRHYDWQGNPVEEQASTSW
ncbi:MAG: hypothetical protein P8Y29_08220 [Gemmatimonadota bacterium]